MTTRVHLLSSMVLGGALVVGSTLVPGTASATSMVTETFEGFSSDDPINAIVFADGTQASVVTDSNRSANRGGLDQAFAFDTNNFTGNDSDLVSDFPFAPDPSITRDLGIVAVIGGPGALVAGSSAPTPNDDLFGGTITFNFDRIVDLLSFDFVDTEPNGNELFATGFNNGSQVGSSGALVAGDGQFGTFTAGLFGIDSVEFAFGGSGALDNLTIAAVPVPAALPMLLGGLGLFGVMGWRRKSTA